MNRVNHQPLERIAGPVGPRRIQSGFSLVELMVSLAISLVILAALVALFVNTSRSNREFERANSMIENGRLAIQVLENDVIHAGFWGTYVPQFDDQTADAAPADVPILVPGPCLAYNLWNADYENALIGLPVQAYDDEAACPALILNKVPNTDVLLVRHADTCVPGESVNCAPITPGGLYFQVGRCTTDPDPFVLGQSPAAPGDPDPFTLLQRECDATAPAEIRRFVSNIYYVRDYALNPGDGTPTLMRSEFDVVGGIPQHVAAVPLIEGIEGFRVELGIDDLSETGAAVDYTEQVEWQDPEFRTIAVNRGDGVPDGDFLRCTAGAPCTVAELTNVTAVKLHVLARSPQVTPGHTDTKTYVLGSAGNMGPFNDGFKRHLFVTTVRLPNPAGRRMTP